MESRFIPIQRRSDNKQSGFQWPRKMFSVDESGVRRWRTDTKSQGGQHGSRGREHSQCR